MKTESIFIPRRTENRKERYLKSILSQKHINGDLDLSHFHLENLGNIETVDGNLYLTCNDITTLGNLKEVNGNLFLWNCNKLLTLNNVKVTGKICLYRNNISTEEIELYKKQKNIIILSSNDINSYNIDYNKSTDSITINTIMTDFAKHMIYNYE